MTTVSARPVSASDLAAAAARALAVKNVRAQLGLSDTPSDWSYEQRTTYNHALADYIAARPAEFSDQDALNAALVSSTVYGPLDDASFDWAMLGAETVKPVGDALKSVGDGALTVANAAKWAIPLLAVLAVIILAEKYSGGTAISTVKKLAK